jgi:hypothetical protein
MIKSFSIFIFLVLVCSCSNNKENEVPTNIKRTGNAEKKPVAALASEILPKLTELQLPIALGADETLPLSASANLDILPEWIKPETKWLDEDGMYQGFEMKNSEVKVIGKISSDNFIGVIINYIGDNGGNYSINYFKLLTYGNAKKSKIDSKILAVNRYHDDFDEKSTQEEHILIKEDLSMTLISKDYYLMEEEESTTKTEVLYQIQSDGKIEIISSKDIEE